MVLAALAVALFTGVALADDLTPPPYRGNPLSVQAEWQLLPGTNFLNLTASNWVDDTDPTTTLHPLPFSTPVQPNADAYQFQLPNWIDQMPVKYMRVQLTWQGNLLPPVSIASQALDGINTVIGTITYVSPLQVDASGIKAYQYYDFKFMPNPDFERINIQMAPNSLLTQVVVDTVSTVPEPATLALIGIGAMIFRKNK
jgi:hypothetical protein